MDHLRATNVDPRLLQAVLDDTDDIVVITDSSGSIQYVNRSFEKITGYAVEEVRGRTPSVLRSRYHDSDYYSNLWQTISIGQTYHGEVINRKKDGTFYFEEKIITPIIDAEGQVTHFVSTGRDVTWRRKAERLLRMRFEISELLLGTWSPDGLLPVLHAIGRHMGACIVEYWAKSPGEYERTHRWSVDDVDADMIEAKTPAGRGFVAVVEHRRRSTFFTNLQNNPLFSWVLPDSRPFEAALACPVMASGRGLDGIILVYKAAPEAQDSETLAALTDVGSQLGEYFRRRQAETMLTDMAYYDTLTGLPNRNLFYDRLRTALRHAQREQTSLAVLFIDLDRFKLINDTFGHRAGDELIYEAASRLRQALRPEDTVSRLGGDEFLILVENFENISDIQVVCQRIVQAFEAPFPVEEVEVFLQASIGVSCYPADAKDPPDLIRQADQAMYRAKQMEGSAFALFNYELDREVIYSLEIQALLQTEIQNRFVNMQVHYQPQVDPLSRRVLGMEALLRWNHPERGWISPSRFIPSAEKAGMIQRLTEFVFERVSEDLRATGSAIPEVSVNVSGKLLHNPAFLEFIRECVEARKIDASRIVLEITETAAVQFFEESCRKLQALKEMGFRIALDDFGTGHSSLNYLMQLPVDMIKIDRSFIGRIGENRKSREIVRLALDIASTLELETVAEGVETPEQMDFLIENGCRSVQGYLTGQPAPLGELVV